MAGNTRSKRPAVTPLVPSKKRKLNNGKPSDFLKKRKASDRGIILIPTLNKNDEEVELSDQDIGVLSEFGQTAGFLKNLDSKGIMRSKKEMQRLHELTKPARKAPVYNDDDLPSLNSDEDEEESDWSSNIDNLEFNGSEDDPPLPDTTSDASNAEMPYETVPRKQPSSWQTTKRTEIRALPIKLSDGRIKDTGIKVVINESEDEEDDESEHSEVLPKPLKVDDVATGARFGRPAIVDVLETKSRKQRVELAKEQIAGICQDILANPESSLGLLKRLHTFSLPTVTSPTRLTPVPNDSVIRQLAILSQLTVFRDILPGYRIRALTESEKAEKVSQVVAQTRDWEQGLVSIYQTHLQLLEAEIKAKSELADVALHCMCSLLTEVTHFNFRSNLMTCIVTRLSKKSWDKVSDMCSQSLITVFRQDLTGVPSLEIVRLLNRMIKERHFKIHPNVLSCLHHLRLRTELGIRASDKCADKQVKQVKEKKSQKVHLSKKAKKALKEQKEINKELREAEAEVDKEERKATQTETLKLLFALYFRILKNPSSRTLLPPSLSGISKFAHLVNIDFFKDLMKVLKDIISNEDQRTVSSDADSAEPLGIFERASLKLMCIITAFELLTGQGEALNIDLSEFVTSLYAMLLPLTLSGEMDNDSSRPLSTTSGILENPSLTDLLFRALNLIFSPRTSGGSSAGIGTSASTNPAWRTAAFAKRLLSASLHWSSSSAVLRTLQFVKTLIAKDPKLGALLSTEDRIFNGLYRPDVDDPQLCQPLETSFWELHVLHRHHWSPAVRDEAGSLLNLRSQ